MQCEALHPAVPVTLVELVAGVRVAEEAGALTHLRAKRVVEVTPPARPEPLQLVSPPRQLGHKGLAFDDGPPRTGRRHLVPAVAAAAHTTTAANRAATTTMLR